MALLDSIIISLSSTFFIPDIFIGDVKDVFAFLLTAYPLLIAYALRLTTACTFSLLLLTDLYDILLSFEKSLVQYARTVHGNDLVVHDDNVLANYEVLLIPGNTASISIPAQTRGRANVNGHMLSKGRPFLMKSIILRTANCELGCFRLVIQ